MSGPVLYCTYKVVPVMDAAFFAGHHTVDQLCVCVCVYVLDCT